MTRAVYTPRAYAAKAMAHMASNPRCALWAKPGMGKTGLVLTHLDVRHRVLGEGRPTLVLSPLQVARSVWSDEAAKWQHLSGLDVAPIVGDERQRLAALRADAPVKTCNYENLEWLVEHAKPWPFSGVVADESTKLKSFRLRQGGARARALGRVAHRGGVDMWINLTGTPAPNGVGDLWGQTWFLDQGARLGRTYSSFDARFFTCKGGSKNKFQMQKVAVPHAADIVGDLLSDICLTLDPADYFPLGEARRNVVHVDLPPPAAARYTEFETEMFTRLAGGEEIEAVSAAALAIKCLQMANGAVYTDDSGAWAEVHAAKLDALESLLSENGGEPILCAYHFKSDLARLTRRFPDALVLSRDEHMAAAKRGEGRLWLGRPAGMGHGVDGLQRHCATVVFFGHWWNLEEREQFIERVGPMRQLQAGTGRITAVHDIVARKTVDQAIVARVAGKSTAQEALLRYMKGEL